MFEEIRRLIEAYLFLKGISISGARNGGGKM
jgi:hypothetical protein